MALTIVATALTIGLSSTGMLSKDVGRQGRALFAQLCAHNYLVEQRLSANFPDTGTTQSNCMQGGHALLTKARVSATPNPNFRRIDVEVSDQQGYVLRLATVVGRP